MSGEGERGFLNSDNVRLREEYAHLFCFFLQRFLTQTVLYLDFYFLLCFYCIIKRAFLILLFFQAMLYYLQLCGFFKSNTFVRKTMLKSAKNQAKGKQHPDAELSLLENYSLFSSMLLSKNHRPYTFFMSN